MSKTRRTICQVVGTTTIALLTLAVASPSVQSWLARTWTESWDSFYTWQSGEPHARGQPLSWWVAQLKTEWQACAVIIKIGTPALPALRTARQEGPFTQKLQAARCIDAINGVKSHGPEELAVLIEALGDATLREDANSSLCAGFPRAVAGQGVAAALKHTNPELRRYAARLYYRKFSIDQELWGGLHSDDPLVRVWAASEALNRWFVQGERQLAHECAFAVLLKEYRAKEADVRREAALLLHRHIPWREWPSDNADFRQRYRAALPVFIGALQDDVVEVRQTAVDCLVSFGPDARVALRELLAAARRAGKDEDRVRQRCVNAFAAMGPQATGAVPYLLELVQQPTKTQASYEACSALAKIGYKRAIPALIASFQQPGYASFRGVAARALGDFGEHAKAAVPVLVEERKLECAYHLNQVGNAVPDAMDALKRIDPETAARLGVK